MFVAVDGKAAGLVTVSDPIKESTPGGTDSLHAENVKVIMLTVDKRNTAKAVADKLGIDDFVAEVLPEDKAETVKNLQKEGRVVANHSLKSSNHHTSKISELTVNILFHAFKLLFCDFPFGISFFQDIQGCLFGRSSRIAGFPGLADEDVYQKYGQGKKYQPHPDSPKTIVHHVPAIGRRLTCGISHAGP